LEPQLRRQFKISNEKPTSTNIYSLATNLYSKANRFIYELIQNADDAIYSGCRTAPHQPFLSFRLTADDRLVVDSNEDGFTKEDVDSLCGLGQSTKGKTSKYIGKKGIGFKSVFQVAHKVHVQSEPYSFAFCYRHENRKSDDDAAMAMTTPILEEYNTLPDGVKTRFILHLLETCDQEALREDLTQIPNTLLLFLNKLKRISISFDKLPLLELQWSVGDTQSTERGVIIKTEDTTTSKMHFWMARKSVKGMPSDNTRDSNEADIKIVLAFPVTEDDVPKAERQHAFAFLPLHEVEFKVRRSTQSTIILI
jgi:hypothetical protein